MSVTSVERLSVPSVLHILLHSIFTNPDPISTSLFTDEETEAWRGHMTRTFWQSAWVSWRLESAPFRSPSCAGLYSCCLEPVPVSPPNPVYWGGAHPTPCSQPRGLAQAKAGG